MTAPCIDAAELAAIADGSIAAAARARALDHLAECSACRRASAAVVRGAPIAQGTTVGAPIAQGSAAGAPIAQGTAAGGARAGGPVGDAAAPDAIGRYVLGAPIGAGAMGVVFRAHDPLLDRPVAIKIVDGHGLDDTARERLLREAKAMARVTAPGVIACFDAGFSDGDLFVAMELVEGTTLRAWAAQRPSWSRAVAVMLEAARGLAAAHAVGLVHRDVKPDNLLVRPTGSAAIGDFGLARAHAAIAPEPEAAPATQGTAVLSRGLAAAHGTRAAGTPRYLAPEVRTGGPATAASDQYAFCLTLLEVITGDIDLARASPPLVPPRLAAILARGLARDPAARWPTMDALADALARTLRPRRHRLAWVAAGLAAVALAVAAWRWLVADRGGAGACTPPELAATLYTPPAYAVIAASVTPEERAGVDQLVRAQLAEHRALWIASCRTAHAPEPEPQTRACLDDAADTLARYLSAFRTERGLAQYLVGRRFAHLQVEACRPGLTATLVRPPPAGVAGLVLGARRRMLHVDAVLDTGDVEAARALATDLAWVDALGDRALAADVAMLRGIIAAWLEDPGATALLARARELAATSGDDVRRVRLLLSLGQFYAAQRNDVALAQQLVDEAAPLVARLGNRQLVADLAYLEALLALAANRLPVASAAIQRAYDATVAVFGDARPELGPILVVRGQIATLADDNAGALRDYTRAVELYAATYGPAHPETLNVRTSLATHALFVHDTERGKAEFRTVIAALEHADPSALADAVSGLCEALYSAEDPEMLPACERAVATAERGYGATHPRTGIALFDLGQALLATDDDRRLPEAIRLLRRAAELVAPMGDDQLALTRFLLARALVANREAPDEARALLEAAIPVLRLNTARAPLVEMVPQWYAPWRSLVAFRHAQAPHRP